MGFINNNDEKFTVTGDWQKKALILQTQYSQLTHDDLYYEKGKDEDLLRRIGNRLSMNREDVINLIRKDLPLSF